MTLEREWLNMIAGCDYRGRLIATMAIRGKVPLGFERGGTLVFGTKEELTELQEQDKAK